MLISTRMLILLTALLVCSFLNSCSTRKAEVVGILKRAPSYDPSVPHRHKFGKLLLHGTNGQIYALKEGKGFEVVDAAGNRLSELDGRYPIYWGGEYRLIGELIELSKAKRRLGVSDDPGELWYPREATALFEVQTMIVNKVGSDMPQVPTEISEDHVLLHQ